MLGRIAKGADGEWTYECGDGESYNRVNRVSSGQEGMFR